MLTTNDDSMSEQGEKVETKKVVVATSKVVTTPFEETEALPQPITKEELKALDYVEFNTPARMLALGEVLAKSKLVPLKTKEDVFVALKTGQELGLPFITSVSQIYPINGRPTLGVHIQKALFLKNGIVFEKIEDAVEIFQFAKCKEDGTVEIVNNAPIIVSEGTAEQQPPNTKRQKVDNRTTYEGTRAIKMADSTFKTITAKGSFTLREAKDAELLDKDVWQKYWRRMLDARAFTNLAKEIANDIILGIHSPSELSNDFYINNEGQEIPTIEINSN